MTIKPRTRTELRNRPTYYEVVAILGDGSRHRLGFTAQINKRHLLTFAQDNGDWLMQHLSDADANSYPTYSRAKGWNFGSVRVTATQNTEYQLAEA